MLHHRKGSCVRAPRSRFGARWSGLLLCVSVSLLLLYRLHVSSWLLPRPLFSISCPATPPYPSLVAESDGKFNWTTITQHHPVEIFAQLPIPQHGHLPKIQHDFSRRGAGFTDKALRKRQRAAVKATFDRFWASYKSRMSGHTHSEDRFSERKALHIDNLDTLWIMGLTRDFEQAVTALTDYDFAPKDKIITMADTARHLNSLVSAYDMTFCKDGRLLSAAVQLGNMLYTFFDTPNRMPVTHWNSTKAMDGDIQETTQHSTVADLTSCNLAFTRLSQLTGHMRFYDTTTHITNILASQQNSTKIPGLWPSTINPATADFTTDNTFTPDTLTHTHLAQMSQLLHHHTSTPQTSMLQTATEATIRDILFRPVTPTNESILAASSAYTIVLPKTQTRQVTLTHNITASSCSLGGSLALSAALSNGDDKARLLTYARLVTQGCIWTLFHAPPSSSPSSSSQPTNVRMMPQVFSMLACSSAALDNMDEDCSFDPTVWRKQEYPGFEVVFDARKLVRPEVIQSVFYMWRLTGERKWLNVAWEMWESVDKLVRTVDGHARDDEEMRMVVQTLKYFYLVFSSPSELSLDEWVIGNDGHAFRVGGA